MKKGFIIIFLLAVLINILLFNCQLPEDETDEKIPVDSIWIGIYDPDPDTEPDRFLKVTVYENNNISGEVGCSDFEITFNGEGIINETSLNADGNGTIYIPSKGTDSFTVYVNGTITGTTMTGTMTIDFLNWDDESGTFNLTKI